MLKDWRGFHDETCPVDCSFGEALTRVSPAVARASMPSPENRAGRRVSLNEALASMTALHSSKVMRP